MKLEPIVISLLDSDLYKFNMDQVIFHKHTDLCGQYYFKCRNKDVVFTEEMEEEINAQIDHLCSLTFKKEELDYLRSIRFIKNDYVEFLRLWRPIRDYVTVSRTDEGELNIVVDGPLFSAMQFEIYLLEIVNEVYFRMKYDYEMLRKSAEEKLDEKIRRLNDGTYTFRFAEFGCRRRLSREWEDVVVRRLARETDKCVGTSNVYLAMKYDLTPIGTYAHEYVQMYQGIDKIPLAYTNYYAMRDWYDEYDGDNGTALTDTVTTDLFLLDFNRSMVNNYSGVRHDSGDPYEWGDTPLREIRRRSQDKAPAVFRQPRLRPRAGAVRSLQGQKQGQLRHRHLLLQRHLRKGAEHRHQAPVRQRQTRRQDQRQSRQEHVPRPALSRLSQALRRIPSQQGKIILLRSQLSEISPDLSAFCRQYLFFRTIELRFSKEAFCM